MKYFLLGFIAAIFLMGSFKSLAASDAATMDSQDLKNKARKKLYPGGRDEQDLQVQAQVAKPIRKFKSPVQQQEPAEPVSEDHD